MKKTMLVTVVALLMLAFAATMVSAGPNPGRMSPMGGNPPNWTDAQKAEMEPLMTEMNDLRGKMVEVHKAMIQKQVSFGYMTQEDADACIARMEGYRGRGPGMMGNGHDMKRGHGMGAGHGMMNDCPMNQAPPTDTK